MKAMIIALWVFTRFVAFLQTAEEVCGATNAKNEEAIEIMIGATSVQLQQKHKEWKQQMPPRSKDYIIKTCNLDPDGPRSVFRGVPALMRALAWDMSRKPTVLAEHLRSEIEKCGGFVIMHLILIFQLLGLCDLEQEVSWKAVSSYLSAQNTLGLFKRFYMDFGVASAEPAAPITGHVYYDPLKQVRCPTKRQAAEFMFAVYSQYKNMVRDLHKYEFIVVLTSADEGETKAVVQFSTDDVKHLEMWLFFCCNSCMHEEMFSDYFEDVPRA